jgi:hypothetical protein
MALSEIKIWLLKKHLRSHVLRASTKGVRRLFFVLYGL